MAELLGRCLCGEIRIRIAPPFNWQGHCHCESCRRATASPMTSFIGVPDGQWHWEGGTPRIYQSSPGVRRFFCPVCGTPLAYQADQFPGETHFYAAILDDPAVFQPEFHVFAAEALPWLPLTDDLPRWAGSVGSTRLDRKGETP
ncbi:MAG: GFA family protein [Pseudomonadota bacterium]